MVQCTIQDLIWMQLTATHFSLFSADSALVLSSASFLTAASSRFKSVTDLSSSLIASSLPLRLSSTSLTTWEGEKALVRSSTPGLVGEGYCSEPLGWGCWLAESKERICCRAEEQDEAVCWVESALWLASRRFCEEKLSSCHDNDEVTIEKGPKDIQMTSAKPVGLTWHLQEQTRNGAHVTGHLLHKYSLHTSHNY